MKSSSAALLLLCACGPKEPKINVVTGGQGDAAPPVSTISSLPDAKMPPPFKLGSKRVTRKEQLAWTGCRAIPGAGDPPAVVDAIAKGCEKTTKMHLVAGPFNGTQNASASAASFNLKTEANHCYRLYAAYAPSIKSIVVSVKDSDGATAAEYPGDDVARSIAPTESLCFTQGDSAQVIVSVGSGDGAFAVQVWRD